MDHGYQLVQMLEFSIFHANDASIKHKTKAISSSSSLWIEVFNSSTKLNIDILSVTTKANCIALFSGTNEFVTAEISSETCVYDLYTINSSGYLKTFKTTSNFAYYYVNK